MEMMKRIKYATYRDYYIPINVKGIRYFLLIKKGFAWDGATGVFDICSLTSCIHDFLYTINLDNYQYLVAKSIEDILDRHFEYITIDRFDADLIYKEYLPTNKFRKFIRFIGVRIFGYNLYQTNTSPRIYIKLPDDVEYETCSHNYNVIYYYDFDNNIVKSEVFRYVRVNKIKGE